VLALAPALTISYDEIDMALGLLNEVLSRA
jgi:4-aminobutyrate aminotransferase-like enzyme